MVSITLNLTVDKYIFASNHGDKSRADVLRFTKSCKYFCKFIPRHYAGYQFNCIFKSNM